MSAAVSLYQLVDQYTGLQNLADEDLPLEVVTDTLEGLTGEIQLKATNVAAFTLNLEAWSAAARDAGEKLIDRAVRIQNRARVIREYLRTCMQAADIKKIEGERFTISRRDNPPKVIIEPDAKVPDEYLQPQDSLIGEIMSAVSVWAHETNDGPVISIPADELSRILLDHFPARAPDKKKIADRLKVYAVEVAKEAEAARRAGRGIKIIPHPLPGCRLEQGERLEIRV